MANFFVWVAVAIVLIIAAIAFNPWVLHKKGNKRKSPMTVNWRARHPDGQVSTIDYFETDLNGKNLCKFSEADFPVHAEFGEDIIEEAGCWVGEGFFIFRCNRNGKQTGWVNPEYNEYFYRQSKFKKIREQKFLQQFELDNYDKFSSSIRGAHESKAMDKEFVKSLIDKPDIVQTEKNSEEPKKNS